MRGRYGNNDGLGCPNFPSFERKYHFMGKAFFPKAIPGY
jgi:hypothetical protein